MTQSRRVLRRLYRSVLTNKVVLGFIIFLEVCIIIVLVYMKFIAKHKQTPDT